MIANDRLVWYAAAMSGVPDESDWLVPAEQRRLDAMPFAKRRTESRLGRWTAKHAVALAAGLPTTRESLRTVTIRNAPSGAPRAMFDGRELAATISMTDRADWAVAIVNGEGSPVGCDLELVEPRSPAFVRSWFTDGEQQLVADAAAPDLVANLVWSAKESALKVLETGLRRPTRTVEVSLGPAAGIGWRSLEVEDLETTATYPGWWIKYGTFVLTIAGAGEIPEPDSLVDPVPLASARPSHRWMERPMG